MRLASVAVFIASNAAFSGSSVGEFTTQIANFCFAPSGGSPLCWQIWSDLSEREAKAAWSTLDRERVETEIRLLSKSVSDLHLDTLLPERKVAILISTGWTATTGFWAPGIRSPDGTSAVVLGSSAIAEGARFRRLLIHELTHMRHARTAPSEDPWMREVVALMVEELIYRTQSGLWRAALLEPETSLTHNAAFHPNSGFGTAGDISHAEAARLPAIYGHQAAFASYLLRLCGGSSLLEALLNPSTAATGFDSMELALSRVAAPTKDAACTDFRTLFRTFERARLAPRPLPVSAFVYFSAQQPIVRTARPALPAWSAGLYTPASGTCDKRDTPVGAICLATREE